MNTLVIRYSEIGSKSDGVRGSMVKVLRQRIEDRLEYEQAEYERVRTGDGRIIVDGIAANDFVEEIAMLPGVASASSVKKTDPSIDSIKKAVKDFDIGETFGVDANRSGEHGFDSQDIAIELGSFIEQETGSSVDLDNPDTWIYVDVRADEAFVFDRRFDGPDGFPAGSNEELAALVSGGIDSPVAAYQAMTRGSDIVPIYFYNRPLAAEDHLLRFRAVLEKLKQFHPGKKWEYFVVDMKEVNERLMDVGRGRMILQRKIMFDVAERIAESQDLKGIVTGESMGQKSSQTASSLELTSPSTKPVFRPLLTRDKYDITSEARKLGTYEEAKIDSACSTMSPENPATSMQKQDFEDLKSKIGVEKLVDMAFDTAEKKLL